MKRKKEKVREVPEGWYGLDVMPEIVVRGD